MNIPANTLCDFQNTYNSFVMLPELQRRYIVKFNDVIFTCILFTNCMSYTAIHRHY